VILGRRQFLSGALGLGATTLTTPLARRAGAQPKFATSPFTLGVASGYPLSNGVVLWTRLAPSPLIPGGGMPPDVVVVDWEVASDDRMGQIVRRGTAAATPAWAHSVHVEVDGLEPGRWYWYRFRAGSEVSPIGRTRTAPAVNASLERLRFAFASCQQYEQGYYGAHHRMAAENLDLLVYLGDYIYEASWGRDHVRHHGAPEPFTLEDYRIRHALYKTDADLQASHAACPWIVTWDDHEVSNDYADDRSSRITRASGFSSARRRLQAYFEHMPLRHYMVPLGSQMRLYDQVTFGNLIRFHLIDDRRVPFASALRAPAAAARPSSRNVRSVWARLTMLGGVQEHWLETSLDRSRARWNVIAQQTLMAQFDHKIGPGQQILERRMGRLPSRAPAPARLCRQS
jgi:alkaline phosphatase D